MGFYSSESTREVFLRVTYHEDVMQAGIGTGDRNHCIPDLPPRPQSSGSFQVSAFFCQEVKLSSHKPLLPTQMDSLSQPRKRVKSEGKQGAKTRGSRCSERRQGLRSSGSYREVIIFLQPEAMGDITADSVSLGEVNFSWRWPNCDGLSCSFGCLSTQTLPAQTDPSLPHGVGEGGGPGSGCSCSRS